ncbi:MAG: hypothetical protein IJE07_06885 [Clostridia bacterium]|nr:hypothetical protein [Clostridia bacterium]
MPHTEPIPYAWEARDASVLAHRFALPAKLPPYTALTVSPGQRGLVFLGNATYVLENAGLHLITASLIHTIAEGAEFSLEAFDGAILPYNARITLFDMRPRLWPCETIDLVSANGEHATINLSLSFRAEDVAKLDACGATFQPAGDDRQMRLDDPVITEAFRRAIADATQRLLRCAAEAPSADEAIASSLSPRTRGDVLALVNSHLTPLGLRALPPHMSPAHATCPYCFKPLSITEIRSRFCSATDEEGKPQKGCGRRLHACPHCQTIVGSDRSICPNPNCAKELLFCHTPGCETYRSVERGRFCPVCRRACYPVPDREFLPMMIPGASPDA